MSKKPYIAGFIEHADLFSDYLKLYPSFEERIDDILEFIPKDMKTVFDQYITSFANTNDRSAHLQQALNLTGAEAKLVLMLVDGTSLADIAKKRGVSRNTVRNQLQNIYQKNHINRLPALINMASSALNT